jgi:hypothetical protein
MSGLEPRFGSLGGSCTRATSPFAGTSTSPDDGGLHLAKPNYAFAKRQNELMKKQKREAKRQKKERAAASQASPGGEAAPPPEADKTLP